MLDLVDVVLTDDLALATVIVVEVGERSDSDEEDGPVAGWQARLPSENAFGDAHVLEWAKDGRYFARDRSRSGRFSSRAGIACG